jgi:glycosyltransferase involved in cell wall biosynthesis
MAKKRVLIVYRSYFPSLSHLGPATAIRNLVTNMSGDYDFHILTLNHEFASAAPLFRDAVHREAGPHAVVEYVPRGIAGFCVLAKRLRENFHAVDIQCAFDPLLAIPALALCRLGVAGSSQIFHTPHGIFMDVIMSAGRMKKKLFCRIADLTGLYRNVVHLAGSPGEETDIRRNHLRSQSIQVVSQFVEAVPRSDPKRSKPANRLKIAFVGRVTAQKNLLFAVDILKRLKVPSTVDIFGDIDDQEYVARCRALIAGGTGNSEIRFKGGIAKQDLFAQLPDYDVLLHPTLGENFGHAIVEALHLGVPVLISDRSPWTDVESHGAGWSLPLSNAQTYADRLEAIYAMGEEWSTLSDGARRYAHRTFNGSQTAARYRSAYG